MKRGAGAIRMGIACVLLFSALSLVVWRQSRALEELRALDAARAQRALLQAERSELQRTIQRFESRAHVVATAGARLGLRVPEGGEIVFLRAPLHASVADDEAVAVPRRGLLTAAEQR